MNYRISLHLLALQQKHLCPLATEEQGLLKAWFQTAREPYTYAEYPVQSPIPNAPILLFPCIAKAFLSTPWEGLIISGFKTLFLHWETMSILFSVTMFTKKFFFQLKRSIFFKEYHSVPISVEKYFTLGKHKPKTMGKHVFQINWYMKKQMVLFINLNSPSLHQLHSCFPHLQSLVHVRSRCMTILLPWLLTFLASSLKTLLPFHSHASPNLILIPLSCFPPLPECPSIQTKSNVLALRLYHSFSNCISYNCAPCYTKADPLTRHFLMIPLT